MAATVDIVLKGIDNASSVIKGVGGALGGLADLAGGAFNTAMGVAAAGVTALGAGLAYSIAQAADSQRVMAQTEAVIKSTGGAAGMTAEAVADLASAISEQTTFADDAIQSAENLLLTFTNIGAKTFPMATQAMVDMAAAMGTDVSSGAIQLGKALNDPVEGISALTRVGVTFTEEQKAMIKSLVEMGDVAGAQKVILDELNKEFGGSAAAQAETFSGRMEQLKNQFDGMAETVGMALLPVLSGLMDTYLKPLIPLAEELSSAFAGFIEDIAAGDLEQALSGLTEWDSIRAFVNMLGIGGTAWYQFSSAASIAVGEIVQSLQTLMQNIGLLLSGDMSLDAFAVSILKIADEYIPGMREQLQPLVLAIIGFGEAVVATLPTIQAQFQVLGEFLANQFAMLGPQLIDNLTTTVTTLTELWTKYGDDIMAVIVITFGFIATTIGGTLVIISGLITSFLQLLNGDWEGAWQTIVDTTTTFMEMVLSLVGTNLETFTATWKTNWEMLVLIVTTTITNILSAIGQAVIDFYNAGAALVQGMINGVNSAVGGLVSAAVNAANSAVSAVKGALGIQSPSKVFAEMGNQMMAGMSAGLTAAAPQTAGAAVGAAGMVAQTTNNYVLNMNNYGGTPNVPDLFSQQSRALAAGW